MMAMWMTQTPARMRRLGAPAPAAAGSQAGAESRWTLPT